MAKIAGSLQLIEKIRGFRERNWLAAGEKSGAVAPLVIEAIKVR